MNNPREQNDVTRRMRPVVAMTVTAMLSVSTLLVGTAIFNPSPINAASATMVP